MTENILWLGLGVAIGIVLTFLSTWTWRRWKQRGPWRKIMAAHKAGRPIGLSIEGAALSRDGKFINASVIRGMAISDSSQADHLEKWLKALKEK